MSKKLILATAAAAAAMVAPQAAHAVTIAIDFNSTTGSLPAYTTAQIIQGFGTGNDDQNFTGSGTVSTPGSSTVPAITATQSESNSNRTYTATSFREAFKPTFATDTFLAVGACNGANNFNCNAGGQTASYTLSGFSSGIQFLSFVFGSLDAYNSVALTFASGTIVTLTGAEIVNGDGTNPANIPAGIREGRVSYNFGGTDSLTKVVFSSTDEGFEIDSIAVAAPEPATWAMMLLGFGMIGSQLRRRNRKAAGKLALA